ncbi:MAG: hypothetical protein ABWK01_01675 [Infirmifilum sp.]
MPAVGLHSSHGANAPYANTGARTGLLQPAGAYTLKVVPGKPGVSSAFLRVELLRLPALPARGLT